MLDLMLAGLQPQDLTIIAGRPAMGKTTLALNMALRMAENYNPRVGFFSLEMSDLQLIERLLAMKTGIDSTRLRIGKIYEDEWAQVVEAANRNGPHQPLHQRYCQPHHCHSQRRTAATGNNRTGRRLRRLHRFDQRRRHWSQRANRNTQIALHFGAAMKQMARVEDLSSCSRN